MSPDPDPVAAMLEDWRQQRPDLEAAPMEVVLRVQRCADRLNERLAALLEPFGLAPFEFEVLSALRRDGTSGRRTPSALCEAVGLTSGAMTHRLDKLEARGFVERRPGGGDRRSFEVVLTRRGRGLVDRALGARMEDAADCSAGLNKAERRTLGALLQKLGADLGA